MTEGKKENQLYRIHWRSKTGKTGNGKQGFTKDVAQRHADKENKSWNGLVEHWIEAVPGGETR